jgi:tellurite resistance protein
MGAIAFAPDEAQEIARALAAVAAADGAILAREASFLDGFAMEHSVAGHSFLATPLDPARLGRRIVDPAKRREVLRLCIQMARADGEFADTERHIIADIAAAFAVSDAELATLVEATIALTPPR